MGWHIGQLSSDCRYSGRDYVVYNKLAIPMVHCESPEQVISCVPMLDAGNESISA